MPVYSVSRPAPQHMNDYSVRRHSLAAMLGDDTGFAWKPSFKETVPTPLLNAGSEKIPTTIARPTPTKAEQVAKEDPGFWGGINKFFQSEEFNQTLEKGMTSYQAREARKMAENEAKAAQKRAQLSAELSRQHQEQARQDMQFAQQAATMPLAPASAGSPGWAMPALIGGGVLATILFLKKKN